jgi:hypothetical protein
MRGSSNHQEEPLSPLGEGTVSRGITLRSASSRNLTQGGFHDHSASLS